LLKETNTDVFLSEEGPGEVRLAHPSHLPLPRSAAANHCQGIKALGAQLGARAGPLTSPARTSKFFQREPSTTCPTPRQPLLGLDSHQH